MSYFVASMKSDKHIKCNHDDYVRRKEIEVPKMCLQENTIYLYRLNIWSKMVFYGEEFVTLVSWE